MTIEARSNGEHALGARVRGVSQERLKDESVRRLLRGLLAYKGVIVLKDIEPSHRLQVAVGEVFGSVKDYPRDQQARTGGEAVPGVGEMVSAPHNCTVV